MQGDVELTSQRDGCCGNRIDYKWVALALLMAVLFLQQGTRQVFSATLPHLRADFSAAGVSSTRLGFVMTLFTVAYGVCVPFAGVMGDIFRRKWIIIVGSFLFSAGIFLCGFSSGFWSFLLAYGLMAAMGQSVIGPSSTSLIGQLHKDSRATAFSIKQMALYAGILISSFASGYLASLGAGAWRRAFWLFGGLGIAMVAVLVVWLRDTKPEQKANGGGANVAVADKPTVGEALMAMFGKPSAMLLTLAFGLHVYVDTGFKTWMPTYLGERFALPSATAALDAVLYHYLGAAIGVWIGGRLSDRFAKARPRVRFEINVIGMLLAVPFIFAMATTDSRLFCCVAMGVFGLARGLYDANLFASFFQVVNPRYRSAATGLFLSGAFILGSASSTVLGFIGDRFSLAAGIRTLSGFYILAALVTLAALVFFFRRDYEEN